MSRSRLPVSQTVQSIALAYVKSMRLYYAFITGIAGWIGLAFYHFLFPDRADVVRTALILALLFLSWGVNQIINDYLGLAEDTINAPRRPMVTGELPVRPALAVSAVAIAVMLLLAWMLNPLAVIPVAAGVLLNVLYEYAKAWSLWGNLVFGLMIAMCPLFGFLAAGPAPDPLVTPNRVAVLLLIAVSNAVMTYYTYFKDYTGDKAAGKKTFIVRHGLRAARYAGVAASLLCTLLCALFIATGALPLEDILFQQEFVFVGITTLFLQCWTGWLYFTRPEGPSTYFNLVTNIRACTAGNCAMLAIFNGKAALYLLVVSYILIGFLFSLYQDERS